MEELAQRWPTADAAREGLRLRLSGGWAWLRPAADRAALRIRTEGADMETAAELCAFLRAQARALDRPEQ